MAHRIGQDPRELQRKRSERASQAAGQADTPAEIQQKLAASRARFRSIPTPGSQPEPAAAPEPAPAPEPEVKQLRGRTGSKR